jgi:hypothetical protein
MIDESELIPGQEYQLWCPITNRYLPMRYEGNFPDTICNWHFTWLETNTHIWLMYLNEVSLINNR